MTACAERLAEELSVVFPRAAERPESIIQACEARALWLPGTRLDVVTGSGHCVSGTYHGLGPAGELQVLVPQEPRSDHPRKRRDSSEVATMQTFTSVTHVNEATD